MKRLESLDVFRGLTIASMVMVNNPGDWANAYAPLLHAEWHGWTFTDLVFPFFLWIVGVAMTLSFAKRVEQGADRHRLLLHTARRAASIFFLGLLLNLIPRFDFATVRIPGVLQRIGICYLIAAAIYLYTTKRGQAVAIAVLLAGYWGLMAFVPVPECGAGSFTKECNFARHVDSMVLTGHMWSATKVWDPEGVISTIPAVATVLFGGLAGHLLRSALTMTEKTLWLLLGGNALLFVGQVLNWWLPINKNLWTSSYTIFMAGMASICFAFCLWFVDVRGPRRWTFPFKVFGMNAIAAFVLSGSLARILSLWKIDSVSLQKIVYQNLYSGWMAPKNASLAFALSEVAIMYGICYLMYRRGWFLKL